MKNELKIKPEIEIPNEESEQWINMKNTLDVLFDKQGSGITNCPNCHKNEMVYQKVISIVFPNEPDQTLYNSSYYCRNCKLGGDKVKLMDFFLVKENEKLTENRRKQQMRFFCENSNTRREGIVLTSEYLKSKFTIKTCNRSGTETIYLRNTETGLDNPNGKSILKSKIHEILGGVDTNHIVDEIIGQIIRSTTKESEVLNLPDNYLVLSNGIIDTNKIDFSLNLEDKPVKTLNDLEEYLKNLNLLINLNNIKFLPFSDFNEYLILDKSPVYFDSTKKSFKFSDSLKKTFKDNPNEFIKIMKIFGYTLMKNPTYKLFFISTGPHDSSKSVPQIVIKNLFKSESVSIPIHLLCDPNHKYIHGTLENKRINSYPDLPKRPINNIQMMKSLVGVDPLHIENKYEKPRDVKNTCLHWFGSNDGLQIFEGLDDSILSKIMTIEHFYTIPERERVPDFVDQIINDPNEMSGILNDFCIKGLILLKKYGFNSEKMTETQRMEETRKKLSMFSDPIYFFIQDCVELENHSIISKDTLYETYKVYCEHFHLSSVSKDDFGSRLSGKNRGFEYCTSRIRIGKTRPYIWSGIKFKDLKFYNNDNVDLEYLSFDELKKEFKNILKTDDNIEFRNSVLYKILNEKEEK